MKNFEKSISSFYDSYGSDDFKKGCNERHLFLYDKLIEYGLKDNSSILELGCGSGIITKLISQKVKSGKIVSSDISPKSIEISKNINKNKNIELIVADIVKFKYDNFIFDYISLFDILEHVPEEEHLGIFQNIKTMMGNNSKLMIHVPTYEEITYGRINYPEELQIIDQPLKVEDIIAKTAEAGLRLEYMTLSNIWHKCDYQLFVLGVNKPYEAEEIPAPRRSLLSKIYIKFLKK